MQRGWLLLVILCFCAAACGRKPPRRPPPPPVEPEPAPPEPKFGGAKVTDTGPIWFACPGNGKHEEKEVEIGNCPKCGQPDYFIPYNNEFYCYKCEALFDKSSAKCPECGFVPKRLNLKHR